MAEEDKVVQGWQADKKPAPKVSKKRLPVIIGVLAVVVAVAGAGFWKWHEQPTFCNAFCHATMDDTVATYYQEPNAPGIDKWGNDVQNANAMMVVVHAQSGVNCLGCHVPSITQQLTEVAQTVTGNYEMPMLEKNTEELLINAGNKNHPDTFCMKSGCHNFTRDDLEKATAEMGFNPHRWHHGDFDCSVCHKSHRASVFYCTRCHQEAADSMPEGWLTYDEGKALEDEAMARRG